MEQSPGVLEERGKLFRRGSRAPLGDLVISADSGPLHIAAAVGTQCISLHGYSDPEVYGPYGIGHVTLRSPKVYKNCPGRTCLRNDCMRAIPVSSVLDVIKTQLCQILLHAAPNN